MKVAVKTIENKAAGDIELDDAVFAVDDNKAAIHSVVKYQLASRQAGTHRVKTRAEVKATGKKPHAQKGTGRARAGSKVRPIDVGGGVAHGPKVRSHAIELPKKLRALALRSVISNKLREGKLIILDDAVAKTHKTKPMAKALTDLGAGYSAVIIGGAEIEANFARSTANLPRIDVLPAQGANVYDIVRRDVLVLTKQAVEALTTRLKA